MFSPYYWICFVHTGCVLSVSLVSNAEFKACYKGCSQIEENLRHTRNSRDPTDDRGKEFYGAVKTFCERKKIKMTKSRAYHPQSQGKVERSHRTLRKKINYDLVKHCRKGVNWVKNLLYRNYKVAQKLQSCAEHYPLINFEYESIIKTNLNLWVFVQEIIYLN